MSQKREYIPANIKAGYTVQEAAKVVASQSVMTAKSFSVRVISYDHGRDVNGNGTAHYICELTCSQREVGVCFTIVESGKRREQVGYSGQNEAALYALSKLGFEVDTSKGGSHDYLGTAAYPLLNFPPVEA